MSDEEASEITNTGEQKLEGDIEKEISKLKYFLEETQGAQALICVSVVYFSVYLF